MPNNNFQVSFRKAEPNRAIEKETTPGGQVTWSCKGNDNRYSNYLIDLYNRSALHKGIINSKVFYLVGEGVDCKREESRAFMLKCNPGYGVNELRRRTFFDMALFDGFAWAVSYNKFGEPLHITHVPFTSVRTNESKTRFWVCRDWADPKLRGKASDHGYWTPRRGGEEDTYETVIHYYSKYSPNNNGTYPVPSYSGALGDIETTIDIVEFHQSNIRNGFTATKLINFRNGKPATKEDAQDLKREFEDMYTGTDGNKFMIAFSEPGEDPIQVHDLSSDNSDKMYQDLRMDCVSNIISAHSLTSKLLAAVETPGSLGSTNELKEAYYAFMKLYVKNTRAIVDEQLQEVLKDFGHTDIFSLEDEYLLPEDDRAEQFRQGRELDLTGDQLDRALELIGGTAGQTVRQIRRALAGKGLDMTEDQVGMAISQLASEGKISVVARGGRFTINKNSK